MKTKDLMEFLRQFNPDSKVYFDITMFNEKKVFMVERWLLVRFTWKTFQVYL